MESRGEQQKNDHKGGEQEIFKRSKGEHRCFTQRFTLKKIQ